jgi:sugar-specific transcriptional regulator TrmB
MADGDEAEATESLQRLGLSQYEAEVFVALVKLGTGTARDVTQVTDVPRSQVYGAAEGLDERGLVEVQQSNPLQYRPVTLEEARERLRSRYEDREARAFDYLDDIRVERPDADERQEDVWMVHGRESVATRTAQLVADAEERVLYGGGPDAMTADLEAELCAQASNGVSVTVVSASEAVTERFESADTDGLTTCIFPETLPSDDRPTGRILAVDGDTLLLSVLGDDALPGLQTETALWSTETGFATIIIRLLNTWLDEHLER